MSRKNHQMVNGRLLQMDKRFSQLKQSQQLKINQWLYEEYRRLGIKYGKPPDSRHNDEILDVVYEKIQAVEIWIPFYEVRQYFFSRKNKFRKRLEKDQPATIRNTNFEVI